MKKEGKKMTKKARSLSILVAIFMCVLVLAAAVFIDNKSATESQEILTGSIKSQLLSISYAAREFLDIDAIDSYNSVEDVEADMERYTAMRQQLLDLVESANVEYIYVLKKISAFYSEYDLSPASTAFYVMDTDQEDLAIMDMPDDFGNYGCDLLDEDGAPVQVYYDAFAGFEAAGVMNLSDEWGDWHTGAVPLMKDGRVIAILCIDIPDEHFARSITASRNNTIMLVATLTVTLSLMIFLLLRMLNKVKTMQAKLERMAHYDVITGLPNRQYLLEHLGLITTQKNPTPFALLFIDLDNFKKVNDNAGHDAGDELLRHIANYIENSVENKGHSFRPAAGALNIAARIGGDEFIQVVPGISTEEQAAAFAQKLLDGFSTSHIDKYIERYNVGLSIGIALFPHHSENFHVLIKYADVAMYHSKRAGKNCYRIYEDNMSKGEESDGQ